VPPRELAPRSQWHGLFRVSTTDDAYTVKEFAVTDSTLVISKLGGSDKRYGDAKLPIALPLRDVKSVDRLETDTGKTFLVAMGGVLFAVLVIGLATWDGPAMD